VLHPIRENLQLKDRHNIWISFRGQVSPEAGASEAIRRAIEERLERERHWSRRDSLAGGISRIQARIAALPVRDSRSADDILGYDRDGLPS
jgi:hypothetical protein